MKNRSLWKRFPKTLTFFVFVLIMLALYLFGSFYYQKDQQVSRILQALNDPKQSIAKYISTADPDFVVTESNAKPLQDYFVKNKKAYQQLKSNISKNRDSKQIRLVQSGTNFLIFPKYTLQVAVYYPQVKTNHPDSMLTVDKKAPIKMKGADQDYYADIGKVLPGRYHFLVRTKVAGRTLKADSITNVWSDKTINMTIKTGSFQVRSVPNGVVYINDKKAKTLNKYGQTSFNNYPLAKNMELYVQAKYDGKTIRSETVKDLSSSISIDLGASDDEVTDYGRPEFYAGNKEKDVYQDVEGDYVVNPLWTGLIKENQAGHILYNEYLKPSKDVFEQEKDYKSLKKWVDNFKKNKKKLKLEVKIKNIMPAGDYYSEVSYELRYKWKDGSNKKEKNLKFDKAIFHEVQGKQLIQTLGKSAR